MPSLTRRRSDNPHQVTRHVYCGDVHVGSIGYCPYLTPGVLV
jgi:hypothetical protein